MFLFTFTIICLFSTINSYYEDNIKARNVINIADTTEASFVVMKLYTYNFKS